MDIYTLIILPIGLGLLGFVEPCTIGGHLVFLNTQEGRSRRGKIEAVPVFLTARTLVMGLFGAVIASLGALLISVQTGMWLVVFATVPRLSGVLERLAQRLRNMRWVPGLVFVLLGLWSIWFGLYVDPEGWSKL